ncbi:MAG: methionyl aminopeptidase [Parcubacteria group bacterium Gr01-1014_48]|nr:MAG: methionyl aminopeptidase [Parcubacteria group bacterium Greene0416_14]TSC71785.1 MAG: methionyl aminopeptidase [Parcubacteria group bacterium Gr01-1014_48]TSD00572.1 MAG: methionyl aminopeptidase [Parcubacteria group bacterium Greene1014_15]TSD08265.1 MAG: methionyl aminopeptidase [Parcubacteria group bacterium Greene0714_4]
MVKTPDEIEILREAGRRLAVVLNTVIAEVHPGVSTAVLDRIAHDQIVAGGDKAAFLNYKPYGANRPFPATLCVSVNDEVVHGIPNEHPKILADGDIVGIDIGLIHRGLVVDMAKTVAVGTIDRAAQKLLYTTEEALMCGINAAKGGKRIGDIGAAIESYARPLGYGIVEELGGHGVGHYVHEEPYIPNVGTVGKGPKLLPCMVLAIEPMLNEGTRNIELDSDGYTWKTVDGKRSAHFEHTILITDDVPEILTLF